MSRRNYHKPNGNMVQCQCVTNHFNMLDGDAEQCYRKRWVKSNLYCESCQDLHGEKKNLTKLPTTSTMEVALDGVDTIF